MSNTIDLSLLAQETVNIKFDEDATYKIPIEPTIGFSTKMALFRKKMNKTKDDDEQLKLLSEVVTMILSQDESHKNVAKDVSKLHPAQVNAIFQIYENRVEENASNPN